MVTFFIFQTNNKGTTLEVWAQITYKNWRQKATLQVVKIILTVAILPQQGTCEKNLFMLSWAIWINKK